jgi:hypothetical protein
VEPWSLVLNQVYAFKVFGNKPGGDCLDILERVCGRSLNKGLDGLYSLLLLYVGLLKEEDVGTACSMHLEEQEMCSCFWKCTF